MDVVERPQFRFVEGIRAPLLWRSGGFGLWARLPDPKRALGAHGVPRIGEARLRRTALTPEPCGARAGYTPPSADVLVLASAWSSGHGTCKEQKVGRDSLLEAFLCRQCVNYCCVPQEHVLPDGQSVHGSR